MSELLPAIRIALIAVFWFVWLFLALSTWRFSIPLIALVFIVDAKRRRRIA